ncbi:hypothetical protein [Dielma fastidiosa]|uniref:Uncharacterized protein n=1 Tax=Dielma fastidiosa TaxID=1034346 RepID=A0AB35UU35_9FIRM|nr:hypothetical protein [Dielma fastidiosa]MDY5168610.1 hypothetical protein [Dielma fastidiosa]
MADIEYFYPEVKVNMNGFSLDKGISIEVVSSKNTVYDYAKIMFTKEILDKINVKKGDDCEILFGYSGNLESIFKGSVVKDLNDSSDKCSIQLKDDMLKFERTIITDTYMNAAPQEIIGNVCMKAGIQDLSLSTQTYVSKTISFRSMNGIKLIQYINSLWSLKHKFYMQAGCFYWGVSSKQKEIAVFSYGSNILSMKRISGSWEMQTVSVPFLKHSTLIRVDHPLVSGDYEISKIIFRVNEQGFVRSLIQF